MFSWVVSFTTPHSLNYSNQSKVPQFRWCSRVSSETFSFSQVLGGFTDFFEKDSLKLTIRAYTRPYLIVLCHPDFETIQKTTTNYFNSTKIISQNKFYFMTSIIIKWISASLTFDTNSLFFHIPIKIINNNIVKFTRHVDTNRDSIVNFWITIRHNKQQHNSRNDDDARTATCNGDRLIKAKLFHIKYN